MDPSAPHSPCKEKVMPSIQKIAPFLWFDSQAEEAANFYCGIFKNSKIAKIARYGKAGFDQHHRPAGSVMTVVFELDGQSFVALNGGPIFKFSEAISFAVSCDTQEEIDYFWKKLSADGKGQCGWLKDKYGLSWQIVPAKLGEMASDPDQAKADRVMEAMLKMEKIDLATLERAYRG
jgi:predicted 3-demethylubiquinone-9 3-methyltransferase (glyoxalase superfamily)